MPTTAGVPGSAPTSPEPVMAIPGSEPTSPMSPPSKPVTYSVIHITGHIVEKEMSKLRVDRKTSVANTATALAKRLTFSAFHVHIAGDPSLASKGCSVFIGQTVLPDMTVLAIYSSKGLSPDLFFPANPAATALLRNPGLKVYGGAIIVRNEDQGAFHPVSTPSFTKLAISRDLYTAPEDPNVPVKPYNPRRRREERRQEEEAPRPGVTKEELDAGRAARDWDWRGLRSGPTSPELGASAPRVFDRRSEERDLSRLLMERRSEERSPPPARRSNPFEALRKDSNEGRASGSVTSSSRDTDMAGLNHETATATTEAAGTDLTDCDVNHGDGTPCFEGGMVTSALWDFAAVTGAEISVACGEELEVFQRHVDTEAEWSYGRLGSGMNQGSVGYFPDQVITTYPKSWKATCRHAYVAERGGYLSLQLGDTVDVVYLDPTTGDLFGRTATAEGWFPRSRVAA